jgi:spore maturation protein CgeB
MRIFYAADYTTIPGSMLWHNNLFLPLVDLGHDVIRFHHDLTPHQLHSDPRDPKHAPFNATHRPQLETKLLSAIERSHRQKPIDIFFSYFYGSYVGSDVIRAIRDMGILTINWYCNGSYQFDLVAAIAPSYDFCLVPEKFRIDDYRRIGATPVYCQEAANPRIYRPSPLPRDVDVSFVGQKYGDRPEYIQHLLEAGIDVQVWGPSWAPDISIRGLIDRLRSLRSMNDTIGVVRRLASRFLGREARVQQRGIFGPPLSDEEMIRMYSRSKISLGFSSCGSTHEGTERILQVRLRDFEAPMSGAFYMVEFMEELAEFFDIGSEVVCYSSKEDLASKCRYYLKHERERDRIRLAGLRRAVNEHTWQKRFETVFRTIGLPPFGDGPRYEPTTAA